MNTPEIWMGKAFSGVVPLVLFNFKTGQLMIYKSVFSTDINESQKIVSNLLAFMGETR